MTRSQALALGILANLLGGASYAVIKWGLDAWPPAILIFARIAISMPFQWLTTPRGAFKGATRGDFIRIGTIGVFGLAAPHLLSAYGLRETESMSGAVLIGMEPITIVLLSWLVLGEKLAPRQMLGIALAVCGGLFVVSRGELSTLFAGGGEVRGNFLLALHGVMWAIYTIVAKPTLARVHPSALNFGTSIVALAILAPVAFLELPALELDRALQPLPIASVLILGLGVSWGVTIMWNTSLKHIRAVEMAVLIFIQPVAGAAIGILSGETLYVATVVGAALIFTGVWLSRER